MGRLLYLIPLAIILTIGVFSWFGLQKDPRLLPSTLIDRQVPSFDLPPIAGYVKDGFSSEDLKGQVTLINVFGSWCIACVQEHPFLMRLTDQKAVPIYGIDWRDKPAAASRWLTRNGDPYVKIGFDADSRVAIDFGVTGAPESFIVDKQGVVRYKHVGPIGTEIWQGTLLPIIQELRNQ